VRRKIGVVELAGKTLTLWLSFTPKFGTRVVFGVPVESTERKAAEKIKDRVDVKRGNANAVRTYYMEGKKFFCFRPRDIVLVPEFRITANLEEVLAKFYAAEFWRGCGDRVQHKGA